MQVIRSILLLSPDYIEREFGPFGKPTIKHQIIIAPKARDRILHSQPPLVFCPDTILVCRMLAGTYTVPQDSIHHVPVPGSIMSLEVIKNKLVPAVIETKLGVGSTRNRGQALELTVARLLGYTVTINPDEFLRPMGRAGGLQPLDAQGGLDAKCLRY